MAEDSGENSVVHDEVPGKGVRTSRGAAALARDLRIPYSRLYNAMSEGGLVDLQTEEDRQKVAVLLQQSAISFRGLIKIFGREMTLEQLAKLEIQFRISEAISL